MHFFGRFQRCFNNVYLGTIILLSDLFKSEIECISGRDLNELNGWVLGSSQLYRPRFYSHNAYLIDKESRGPEFLVYICTKLLWNSLYLCQTNLCYI